MIRCTKHDEVHPVGYTCKLCAIGAPSIAETASFLAGTQTKYLLAELEKRHDCNACSNRFSNQCNTCVFYGKNDHFVAAD